jgi:hypothetical protein
LNVIPAIWTDGQFAAGDYLNVSQASLYISSGLITPWQPLPIQAQLAACQRYCEVLGTNASVEIFGAGQCSAAGSSSYIFVPWTVCKRAIPTVTYSAASNFYVEFAGSNVAVTSLVSALNGVGLNSVMVNATVASGGTAGDGVILYANGTGAKITIDAEL